jgi:hypothetical protein
VIIQTQYIKEKNWVDTNEKDLLRIVEEEIGDVDPNGTLEYIKQSVKNGKTITVGDCRFRAKK